MSVTYSIGCKDCKESIWIGQTIEEVSIIYFADEENMKALNNFLYFHIGHNLIFDKCEKFIDQRYRAIE